MTENPINPTQSPAVVSAASALIGDPARFGRVGEDGTVYVITPEGDKPVGSYPGKSNDEALAYFVRKFEAMHLKLHCYLRELNLVQWFREMRQLPLLNYANKFAN